MSVTVKNKSLKISPGGVISLPVSARRAIGMKKGAGAVAYVTLSGRSIVLSLAESSGGCPTRVSKGGQMVLDGEAGKNLAAGEQRHYWLEADDERAQAVLHPY
jgi:hypothetical protein